MPPPPDPWDDSLSGGGGWRCVGMEPTLADASMARTEAGTSSPGRGTALETPVPHCPPTLGHAHPGRGLCFDG